MMVCLYSFVYMKMSQRGKMTHTESGFLVDWGKEKGGRNGFRKGKYCFFLESYENVINFKGGKGFTSL